jgi:hypothetical protein
MDHRLCLHDGTLGSETEGQGKCKADQAAVGAVNRPLRYPLLFSGCLQTIHNTPVAIFF